MEWKYVFKFFSIVNGSYLYLTKVECEFIYSSSFSFPKGNFYLAKVEWKYAFRFSSTINGSYL